MKISVEISRPDDIAWLEGMTKERRLDTLRNCVSIGRLALEQYQIHVDGSKHLEPLLEKFCTEMTESVERTLETVTDSVQSINQTKQELIQMSAGIHQQLAINTNTVMESVKTQQNITEKMMDPITSRIDKMNEEVEKIFSVKGTSNTKGKLGESLIAGHIQTAFPDYEILNMSNQAHEADYHLHTDFGKVLLEIKTYTASVNKDQIQKLYDDIDRTGMELAIFLSTTSGIVGKKHIGWEVYGKNRTIILFFPNSSLSPQGIIFSILFLRALAESGIQKETSDTFYKSEEEVHTMLQLFDELYSDLMYIGEKQTKLRFDIGSLKQQVDKLLDELYKQSFELELDQKRSLEKMYGSIKEKLSIRGKSIDCYQWIGNQMDISKWIESLSIKSDVLSLIFMFYERLQQIDGIRCCYETSSSRMLVVDGSTQKVLCECVLSKTKAEITFQLPKSFDGSISMKPRYESLKGSELLIPLSKAIECYDLIEHRIKQAKEGQLFI